jgi:hypothetical protein
VFVNEAVAAGGVLLGVAPGAPAACGGTMQPVNAGSSRIVVTVRWRNGVALRILFIV